MSRHCLQVANLTDAGRVRAHNEDSVIADGETGVVALADGMGGHRAGDVASRMAVDIVGGGLKARAGKLAAGDQGDGKYAPRQVVDRLIVRANKAIYELAQSRPDCQGMGTTLAVALFHGDRVTLAHIGDSRIYRLRGGKLELLTRDDSLLRNEVELGLIAAANASESHNRHLVTRALGMQANVAAHLREEKTCDGDLFLLCSDGLNDLVADADIELIVNALQANLPLAATHLVQLANDNGGYDNVSVALVKVGALSAAARRAGWLERLFGWIR